MTTERFLKKLQPEPDGLDFEGLRREGIRLVQEFSGDEWTDYNLHDPGVTILEQVCYGLTDLIYRSGFSVADYLTADDGEIDYEGLALHRPDEALASGPVTVNDYRKLLLDSVPNLENVWLSRAVGRGGEVSGLYRVHLQLSDRVANQEHEGVEKAYADAVRKIYAAHRNLCEDLDSVHVVRRHPYGLRGEINIVGSRLPSVILAEIYFTCAEYLAPAVEARSYLDAYKSGKSLEELFTGVVTQCGYIPDENLHPWRGHFSIQELSGRILSIEGVDGIRWLEFVPEFAEAGTGADVEGTETIKLIGDHPLPIACLALPNDAAAMGVELFRGDKICSTPLVEVKTEFARLYYGTNALSKRRGRFDWVDAMLPKGSHRSLGAYSSIQNHFPDVYGVNAMGMMDSTFLERREAVSIRSWPTI